MPFRSLSIPTDIPWKRLGASADMVDITFGRGGFPPKWRSSIAVFYHQPDELPDAYESRRITYLKVTNTITGYQIDQKEVGVEYNPSAKRFKAVPVTVRARGTEADGEWPRMELRVNGSAVEAWSVDSPEYDSYVTKADLRRGDNMVEVAFTNDLVDQHGNDRNLFVDFIAVGPIVMHPNDRDVEYHYRDANGISHITQGQTSMWSQGELQFPVHYVPRDWMSQFVKEYENLGAYLPCYGAMLQVAVFPEKKEVRSGERRRYRFAEQAAANNHPNPWNLGRSTLEIQGAAENTVVDRPDMPRALELTDRMTITLDDAATHFELEAYGDPLLTIEAWKGGDLVDSVTTGIQLSRTRKVVLEYGEFDKIVILPPAGEAFVTEYSYKVEKVEDLRLEDYPYIMDFDPKKREMYEVVSDTNEVMSRSLSALNIKKGMTNTESEEVVDIDRGWGFNVALESAASGFKSGTAFGYNTQGESGSRNMTSEQRTNQRTIDRLQEQRENTAQTTTLSQMYHLFNGYHLGTNRSVFFMLPRPHVTEVSDQGAAARTFVNGPRRMEGVQEVFLIVNHSKDVSGLCIEALLETAHLDWTFVEAAEAKRMPEPPSMSQLTRFLDEKYGTEQVRYYHTEDEESYHHVRTLIYWHPGGQLSRCKQHKPGGRSHGESAPEGFRSLGYRKEKQSICQDWSLMSYDDALTEYFLENPPPELPPIPPEINTNMIMTARSLQACLPDEEIGTEVTVPGSVKGKGEWVSFEGDISYKGTGRVAIDNNLLIAEVGNSMKSSLASGKRYAKRKVDFLGSDFALARLSRSIAEMPDDDPSNVPVAELKQLDRKTRKMLKDTFPEAKTRKEAAAINVSELAEKLEIEPEAARDVRRRLLGLVPAAPRKDAEDQKLQPEKGLG